MKNRIAKTNYSDRHSLSVVDSSLFFLPYFIFLSPFSPCLSFRGFKLYNKSIKNFNCRIIGDDCKYNIEMRVWGTEMNFKNGENQMHFTCFFGFSFHWKFCNRFFLLILSSCFGCLNLKMFFKMKLKKEKALKVVKRIFMRGWTINYWSDYDSQYTKMFQYCIFCISLFRLKCIPLVGSEYRLC